MLHESSVLPDRGLDNSATALMPDDNTGLVLDDRARWSH